MADHLWLIGMMGSGKSAVGARVAELADTPFRDTDGEVAKRAGCSVAQLWGERGEASFRAMEAAAIAELAEGNRSVIACGGGAVIDPQNVELMLASGTVVWLTAPVETLTARVGASRSRPLLAVEDPAGRLAEILAARHTMYEDAATFAVSTDERELDDIAAEIEALWNRS